MPTRYIIELRTHRAGNKLAAHGLTEDDRIEVWLNDPRFFVDRVDGRTLMIGPDFGGRSLSIVIEPVPEEHGVWDVVTGWPSTNAEAGRWRQAK